MIVLADPLRLRQLLILLLDNAVHYSHLNGVVKISVQEKFIETARLEGVKTIAYDEAVKSIDIWVRK